MNFLGKWKNKMNLISVITPIYHGENYIENLCFMIEKNSINLQEVYPDAQVEFVLVNDSPEIIIHAPNKIKNYKLKIINNETNQGIHYSRVNGIINSNSEFVYMLDQDDVIEDDFLLSQYEKIGKFDIIISNGYRAGDNFKKVLYRTRMAQKLALKKKMYIYGTDMILSPGQCLIRRNSIPDNWRKHILKINGCDDFLLWLLMFNQDVKFVVNYEKIYFHIDGIHNYSASSESMTKSYDEMCKILAVNNLINMKSLSVLKRRYRLKISLKSKEISTFTKVLEIVKNLDTLFFTILYKGLGYH